MQKTLRMPSSNITRTQPLLFKYQEQLWMKLDNTATQLSASWRLPAAAPIFFCDESVISARVVACLAFLRESWVLNPQWGEVCVWLSSAIISTDECIKELFDRCNIRIVMYHFGLSSGCLGRAGQPTSEAWWGQQSMTNLWRRRSTTVRLITDLPLPFPSALSLPTLPFPPPCTTSMHVNPLAETKVIDIGSRRSHNTNHLQLLTMPGIIMSPWYAYQLIPHIICSLWTKLAYGCNLKEYFMQLNLSSCHRNAAAVLSLRDLQSLAYQIAKHNSIDHSFS